MRHFADKGVAATRVEDVVAEAGVAWGTFYRYFPRKEDVLLEAAVIQFRAQLLPLVESDLGDHRRSTYDKTLHLFIAMLEPGPAPPRLRAEILEQVIEHRERFAAMLGAGEQPLVMLVARVLTQGQERGEIRTDLDALTLAGTLLVGTVFATIYSYYGALRRLRTPESAVDFDRLVERVYGIIWRGVEAR